MTMEDAPRTETHQGKETVPQDPGRHSGQDKRGWEGEPRKTDLGNELHEKLKWAKNCVWNQKALLQMTAGIFFKLCIVWKFRWPWLLNNQAEGPSSPADLVQRTEDSAADKHSPLGRACEYRQALDLDFYRRDHMCSTNLSFLIPPNQRC